MMTVAQGGWYGVSHEDDVYYARYIVKRNSDMGANNYHTILRQVLGKARVGGIVWMEVRFYIEERK